MSFRRRRRLRRVDEERRRVRAGLQKNRVDDDHQTCRDSAEDGERIDRTTRRFRPEPEPEQGGPGGESRGRTRRIVGTPLTHFSSPVYR